MTKIIEVKNLDKKIKKKIIHDNLSLDLNLGDSIALIGRNGSGKTILAEMISNLQSYNDGEINYLNDFKKDDIALLFQKFNVPNSFKVDELINFYKLQYNDRITNEEVEKLIDTFDLRDKLKTRIKKLSGGERQKVNLLTTLMKKAKLLILDEFVTGLDVISIEKILLHLNKLKTEDDLTFIIISHQAEEIRKLSNRICVLKDGKINEEFITKDIENKYNGDFQKFLKEVLKDE